MWSRTKETVKNAYALSRAFQRIDLFAQEKLCVRNDWHCINWRSKTTVRRYVMRNVTHHIPTNKSRHPHGTRNILNRLVRAARSTNCKLYRVLQKDWVGYTFSDYIYRKFWTKIKNNFSRLLAASLHFIYISKYKYLSLFCFKIFSWKLV